MDKLKILNICASSGNIGDDASHVGLKRILAKTLPKHSITKYDIRDFYMSEPRNERKIFDDKIAEYINNFDLCIIGGGAFLDYPITGSINGPTIDLTDDFLRKINIKTVISSVSCRPKAENDRAAMAMSEYLSILQQHPKIELLLRNDGSINHLNELGIESSCIEEIVDHGFFLEQQDVIQSDRKCELFYCCLNVVNDQLLFYGNDKDFSNDYYYQYITNLINRLDRYGFEKIVLIPHIHKDLISISEILSRLSRKLITNKIIVSELSQGERSAMKTFGVYDKSNLNIGTRFHTNVCSFALDRPTIPIAITGRLKALCQSLGIKNSFEEILDDFDKVYQRSCNVHAPHVKKVLVDKKKDTLQIYYDKLVDLN